ncbi:MAG: flavodoxin [Eubacterium sp.]|nr:flavodoxin [Eubacterium sp.]
MSQKILVAYFSASGETAKLAKTLAAVAKADLFEIKPEQAYTSADLDWNNKKSRSSQEMNDKVSRPAIAEKAEDMDTYDTVFVGFPIWWYEAPRIIQTFLESYDFSGKTVIPFATSGGSGMGKTVSILKQSCSIRTKWKDGKRMSSTAGQETVQDWVNSLNL